MKKIFFAVCNIFMQTSIYLMFELNSVYMRSLLIANKSALVNAMFIALKHNLCEMELFGILLWLHYSLY